MPTWTSALSPPLYIGEVIATTLCTVTTFSPALKPRSSP